MNEEWKEALRQLCVGGEDEGMAKLLPVTPTETEFFMAMRELAGNAPDNWTHSCTSQYSYHETDGYAWLAWGKLYIAIPEFDTYEKHEGRRARIETLIHAVQGVQHSTWQSEDGTQHLHKDIDNYLKDA